MAILDAPCSAQGASPNYKSKMIALTTLRVCLLAVILSYSCYTDLRYCKIFNHVILFGLIGGLGLNLLLFGEVGIKFWLLGLIAGLLSFMPMYLLRGMAAGDVKLTMVLGGIIGTSNWLPVMIWIYMSGGLIAVLYVVYKKRSIQLLGNLNMMFFLKANQAEIALSEDNSTAGIKSVGRMPFAIAITLGTFIGSLQIPT